MSKVKNEGRTESAHGEESQDRASALHTVGSISGHRVRFIKIDDEPAPPDNPTSKKVFFTTIHPIRFTQAYGYFYLTDDTARDVARELVRGFCNDKDVSFDLNTPDDYISFFWTRDYDRVNHPSQSEDVMLTDNKHLLATNIQVKA